MIAMGLGVIFALLISLIITLLAPQTDLTLEVHAFLVTEWDGEPVNSAPDEHDDLRWFSPSELASLKLADPAALSCIVRAV